MHRFATQSGPDEELGFFQSRVVTVVICLALLIVDPLVGDQRLEEADRCSLVVLVSSVQVR